MTERSRAQARSRPRQLLYQPETTNKCLKDPENQSRRSASYERRSAAMIETGRGRELQNKIERYRALEREVTDSLAAALLRDIVRELEASVEKQASSAGGSAPGERGLVS
ncbi:MAG TPA: hypothetical protein VM910_32715 [Bradyrhizobium sp.]|nr:hypothetical protein [Bradyrhizobium sp.]